VFEDVPRANGDLFVLSCHLVFHLVCVSRECGKPVRARASVSL